jgi:hypothetical protein
MTGRYSLFHYTPRGSDLYEKNTKKKYIFPSKIAHGFEGGTI